MSSITELMSALAANRKRWFELIDSVEQDASCSVDETELEAAIDSDYSGRDKLTAEEANNLLMQVARRKKGQTRSA